MDTENSQWDIADKDFSLMLQQKKVENKSALSDVLTSAFLCFRNKQKEWLQSFFNKSLAYLDKKGYNEANDFYIDNQIRFSLLGPRTGRKDSSSDDTPMFKSISEPDTEYKQNRIKSENERILNGIQLGDQKVFNELYENEFPKVVRYLLIYSGDIESAKDIFQDAIIILIEKVHRMELDLTCSIKTYLFSISKNLWMEQLRKAGRYLPINDSHNQFEPDISLDFFEINPRIFEEVTKAINQLGDSGKRLLNYYYYERLSCKEIAKRMGYANAASVRNQKYKYLEQLKKKIEYVEN